MIVLWLDRVAIAQKSSSPALHNLLCAIKMVRQLSVGHYTKRSDSVYSTVSHAKVAISLEGGFMRFCRARR